MSENVTVSRLLSIGFISMLLLTLLVVPGASAASVTSLDVSAPKYGSSPTYVTLWTEFTLTALPSANIWYQWAGYNYTAYTGPFTASVEYPSTGAPIPPTDLEGLQTLYYNSTDALGQSESPKSFQVFVDNYYPVTEIEFVGDYCSGSQEFISQNTMISLEASDSDSGVAMTHYRIDSGTDTLYSAQFKVAAAGAHTIYYYSEDNVQNAEPEKTASFFVDTETPSVQITPHQPTIEVGGNSYATPNTMFEVQTSDNAGVAETAYTIDNGAWITYTVSFSVAGTGVHTIKAKAMDIFDNSAETSISIIIDSTSPETSINGTTATIIDMDAGDSIEILCYDSGVGECTIYYSMDAGNTWAVYTGPVRIEESMSFMYYGEDGLGNQGVPTTVWVNAIKSEWSLRTILLILWLVIGSAMLVVLYLLSRRKPKDAEKDKTLAKKTKKDKPKKRKIKRNN